MTKNHHYEKGLHFEALMRRAYKTNEKSKRKGTDSAFYETLVNYENASNLYRKNSFSKELERVRIFLLKAMNEFLKRKLTADERMKIEEAMRDFLYAQSTTSLDHLIDYALDITQPYKEW